MEADVSTNILILAGIGAVLFFIILTAIFSKKGQRNETKAVPEEKRLFESKEEIPKLPRNETLYHILKNSSLAVNKIVFDLNYVFDEVAALLRKDIRSSEVEIVFDIDPNVPAQLIGSPKRLSRVLINLIENAVQYSDHGVIELRVEVLQNNGSECQMRYVVHDQGRGMSREALDALLVDPALRVREGKMPLGCYVAHALVKAEGGDFAIESVPDAGTTATFSMTFKLPQTHAQSGNRLPSKSCKTLKAAVVARHTQTAEVLKKHLELYLGEVNAMVLESSMKRADELEENDLVLIDHRLCDRELTHALKRRGANLILLQSIIEPMDATAHFAADYQLSLPFTHAHLLEMLIVFYGEDTEGEQPGEASENTARFDTFVSDADIPVAANVSKKDFDKFVGAKLLIVEDNPINQRVIQGLLGDSGMLLYFAENGLEALDVLAEDAPFDLVLMDINMPVLDGIETTKRIRAQQQFDAMPVVAFTGLNLAEQIEKMREAGMNAHMAKPLNIGRFYSVFNHFLPSAETSPSV